MSKFVCINKFLKDTLSKYCVIKELDGANLSKLYFVMDIYQPDCLLFLSGSAHAL